MDFDSYGSLDDVASSTSQNTYGLTNIRGVYTNIESQLTRGTTITPEYRFVLNGRGFSGVYIAPFARYMYYEYKRDLTTQIDTGSYGSFPNYTSNIKSFTFKDSELYTYHSLGIGVIAGKQFVFKNRVLFDVFGGPVYSILMESNKSINSTRDIVIGAGIPNTYIRGYGIRAGFSVGFLF
jgi:VanZ family protein